MTDASETTLRREIEEIEHQLQKSIASVQEEACIRVQAQVAKLVADANARRDRLREKLLSVPATSRPGVVGVVIARSPSLSEPGTVRPVAGARAVILELFARSEGPVRSTELTSAVVKAGLTRSAGEKVKQRLIRSGEIVGDPSGYLLASRAKGVGASREESG